MQSQTTDSTRLYEFLAWLELNKKRVIAVAVGALLLFVIIYVYMYFRAQAELAASRALMALRPAARGSETSSAPSATDLLKIAAEYPSTSAGERALLMAAGNLFAEGKYAEAQTQFEKFSRSHAGSPLAPIAALGVAASLDALDKVDEALSAYQSTVNQFPDDPVAIRARLALALLHETKNQPEQAHRIYAEISQQAGAGGAVTEAAMRKQKLERKFPQLAQTNAPTASASTTVKPASSAPTTNAVPAAARKD